MKSQEPDKEASTRAVNDLPSSNKEQPEWTDGLRHIYDSVVDEPLPDSLKDLLAKLDDGS